MTQFQKDFFEWQRNGAPPTIIIFQEIKNIVDDFVYKNLIAKGIQYNCELQNIILGFLENKLLKKSTIDYLLLPRNIIRLESSIKFLLNQYYESELLNSNPVLEQLIEDTKNLFKKFPETFILSNPKFPHKSNIRIDKSFVEISLSQFDLKYSSKKFSRMLNLYNAIIKIILTYTIISYSDLMEELKDLMKIEKSYFFDINDLLDYSDDDNSKQNNEGVAKQTNLNTKGSNNLVNHKNYSGLIKDISSDTIDYPLDIGDYFLITNKYLSKLTQRQRSIFILWLRYSHNNLKKTSFHSQRNVITRICEDLQKKKQTIYNELNICFGIFKKEIANEELSENDLVSLINYMVINIRL